MPLCNLGRQFALRAAGAQLLSPKASVAFPSLKDSGLGPRFPRAILRPDTVYIDTILKKEINSQN